MTVDEIERRHSTSCKSVSANASGPSVPKSRVVVVITGNFVIRRAGVECGANAKRKPVVGVDVSDQIEALKPVLISATPFSVWLVLVLRKGVDAAGVVFESRERVLALSRKPTSGLTSEG